MRDALGNELKVGELVLVQLDRPLMFGEIVEIAEGGLVRAADAALQPGRVAVLCKHVIQFDPRGPCGTLLALRNDNGRIKVESEEAKLQPLPN